MDYREILSQYGELRALTFRTMPDRNVRIGGEHFSLDLKQDSKMPNAINVAGDVIHIVDKNSRTTCSFCGKPEHLRYQCQGMKRERTLALERRAEEELKEQEKQKEAKPQEEEDMEEDPTNLNTFPADATITSHVGSESEEYDNSRRTTNTTTTTITSRVAGDTEKNLVKHITGGQR